MVSVATSFYQRAANHVFFYPLFNLRNLLYLIFLSDKYDITQHPNYKYTADADPKNAFSIEDFLRARLKLKPTQGCDVYEIDAAADD